jgi:hypothetical protein
MATYGRISEILGVPKSTGDKYTLTGMSQVKSEVTPFHNFCQ